MRDGIDHLQNRLSDGNGRRSLSEVFSSVKIPVDGKIGKKMLAYFGPAYLVSVGYMDPGNWATDIAGGSQFGFKLIWVLLMSNIMAVLLQSLSARLGVVHGRDLAQASKESFPPLINFCLYIFAEIAIAACDLAEVLGMAIGLQLLFGIPLIWGVCLTLLDTFLLLILINRGMRMLEAFILALIAVIGLAFFIEMILARPSATEIFSGFIPHLPNNAALYISIGIIGATVMPHNLYLHSSLVQSRKLVRNRDRLKEAIKFNLIDSIIALNLAFFVNAAILILAASTFYKSGMFNVSNIQDAHQFLNSILGTHLAPVLFAVALIASGQSSTITGTLAGQIVMEGYLNIRIQPWIRRIITRLIAIIPAVLVILISGEESTGKLLVFSQVVLSFQLGFAVIPLIHFVSDKSKMGTFAIGGFTKSVVWFIAVIIVMLNARLIANEITNWLEVSSNKMVIWLTAIPFAAASGMLLLFITFLPFVKRLILKGIKSPHTVPVLGEIHKKPLYSRIAVAIDFSPVDRDIVRHVLTLADPQSQILIIHVVETAGAIVIGNEINDFETHTDHASLNYYLSYIKNQGFEKVSVRLGFGNPKKSIPKLVNEFNADLLIMGAHGHNFFKDILLGTTVNTVRHRVKIPVFIVKDGN
jgi:manganese transport protein